MHRTALASYSLVAILFWLVACAETTPEPASAHEPNVVIVMIDALRRDHLGIYGHEPSPSPFLDELATESVVFDQAYAHCSQTILSTASFFTSEFFPPILIFDISDLTNGHLDHQSVRKSGKLNVLAPRPGAFPVVMGVSYETVGFLTNPHHHADSGFADLFARAHILLEPSGDKPYFEAERLRGAYVDWIRGYDDSEKPFLAYVHFMDVHNPYRPPKRFVDALVSPEGRDLYVNGVPKVPPTASDLAYMRQLYDGEISYVDSELRQIFEATQEATDRDTIFLITSDHGDEFMEHGGLGHGRTLEKEMIWVPLILHGAAFEPTRYSQLVRQVDVGPTILDLAGLPIPDGYDGESLVSLLRGDSRMPESIYSTAFEMRRFMSLTTPRWHFIQDRRTGEARLYDQQADPAGLHDVAADHPEVAAQLVAKLKPLKKQRALAAREAKDLERRYAEEGLTMESDSELIEQLEALGYLGEN